MGMAGGSILDRLFKILGTYTVQEDSSTLTVDIPGTGVYMVVGDPVMTQERATTTGNGQNIVANYFIIYNNGTATNSSGNGQWLSR